EGGAARDAWCLVEAAPARTVNVMPPVTGRIIDLMAQLGGRVTKDQELAIIRPRPGHLGRGKSSLRAQACQQTLDRLMVLERTSAIAVRDREQAQSDFAQARSENEHPPDGSAAASCGSRFQARADSTGPSNSASVHVGDSPLSAIRATLAARSLLRGDALCL